MPSDPKICGVLGDISRPIKINVIVTNEVAGGIVQTTYPIVRERSGVPASR